MPSLYKCAACGRTFSHPAKQTIEKPVMQFKYSSNCLEPNNYTTSALPVEQQSKITLEVYVCPFCESNNFVVQEEPIVTEDVEGVYVADLVSGANPEIDKLLASGWIIKGRFAKQYTLEKPKPKFSMDQDFVADAAKYAKECREKAQKTVAISEDTFTEVPKP